MQIESTNIMATGRITKKILEYIQKINKENQKMSFTKNLRKEVEIGKYGTQKYVVKQGENKGKIL
tara:strand:- start:3390 stop:3584 length:195 start_codon:yes stop_codon:yes gene_type:complete